MERSSPPPFSAYPIPRSFPFVLPSRRRRPRPDRTAVQRGGGCGVAYVCKSWPGTGGCGTLQPCEYACTRVQRRRPLAIRSCVRLALGVQSGAVLCCTAATAGKFVHVTRPSRCALRHTLVVVVVVVVLLLLLVVVLFKLERSMSRPLRSMRPFPEENPAATITGVLSRHGEREARKKGLGKEGRKRERKKNKMENKEGWKGGASVDRFSRSREPEWNGNINRWSVTENRKNIPGKAVTGWNTNVLEFPSATVVVARVVVGVLLVESGEAVPVPVIWTLLRRRFKLATRSDSSVSSQLVKGEDINGREGGRFEGRRTIRIYIRLLV